MNLDITRVRNLLQEFDFRNIFTEELGWDHYGNSQEVSVDGHEFNLNAVAEKRGMAAFLCGPLSNGNIPDYAVRRKIERQIAKSVHEHIIIYSDHAKTTQIWQWVKREAGKPTACREHAYHVNQPGDSLIQKIRNLAVTLDEEETITIIDVTGKARTAFDVEKVTKKFYDRFKNEHDSFLEFIEGIPDDELHRWYASVMLNRLMFIYFIQKKRFLAGDDDYLRNKLVQSREQGKDLFYKKLLCPLFFDGFAMKASERSASINKLLGDIPYLNGGLFLKHQIEELHGRHIEISDKAFEKLFDFFDLYQWHLDERPLRKDNEINPDVLGYIFEKYINQKQMGAYYTKEDITEYISKNTVIPFLFDAAKEKCKIAFVGANSPSPSSTIWQLLQSDPDRYIYSAVRKGVDLPLPAEIESGIIDVSKRTGWNKPASPEYALPTEIWREVVARRQRYEEVKTKMLSGEVRSINDLITYNLDIRQFAQDVIYNSEGPELLRAFYHAIENVTVLDPTCGSGAFLFAALNVLEPLYEGCLERMQVFLDELEINVGADLRVCPDNDAGKGTHTGAPLQKKHRSDKYGDFKKILNRVAEHPNLKYFIYKSIIVNNLYGVDIMEEAVEICKLRLFLKLVAQIDSAEGIEPLPDIDFNIRAGNTLVGFATYDEVKQVVTSKLDFENNMGRIEEQAEDVDRLFKIFHQQQTELGGQVTPEDKQELRDRLKSLEDELNQYLAGEYGIDPRKKTAHEKWRKSHQPFHWFIEFYGILKNGGFDVIIGNPPYVDFKDLKEYMIKGYKTSKTRNLYSLILERCQSLVSDKSRQGFIVPVSSVATEGYLELQETLRHREIAFSSFDDRPSHLFDGLDKNTLSILLLARKVSQFTGHSTRLSRWSAEERTNLFPLLKYTRTPTPELKGCWPKIGSPIEEGIWNKIFHRDKPLSTFYVEDSSFITYYSRKVNAFLQILNFVPEVRDGKGHLRPPSEFKKMSFSSKKVADAVFCCFNSTLYRWFMDVVSDGSHVNRREVDNIRFDPQKVVEDFPEIGNLASRLSNDLNRKSETRTMRYKHDTLTVQCIIPKNSKPIIDEIDRMLAKHYGFTDEELDFIINYDIKYRMGRESEGD